MTDKCSIDIHRAALLQLIARWCELVKPLAGKGALPEEADMSMLAAIRLCSTKLAGTGSGFAYFALEDVRKYCYQFTLRDWHLLSVDLLANALPTPEADERTLPLGQVRRLRPYWARVAPLVSHDTSAFRRWMLEILWACRGLDDGMTAITYALYENVLNKILYVDESLALLFSRVNHRLTDDGGRLFTRDEFRGQFLARLAEADRQGANVYANTFKYLDDAIAARLVWAYGREGLSVSHVANIEQEENIKAEYDRLLKMLEAGPHDDYDSRITFAIGKRYHDSHSNGITLIRDAAGRGLAEAQLFMAEYLMQKGRYHEAARYAYLVRNEKRAATILRECFTECQPGELDYLKWVELDPNAPREPESKKCLAADLDDRGCIARGACGIKCDGEWAVGDCGRAEGDYGCPYEGRWTQCPLYCGPVCRPSSEPLTSYCGSLI